MVRIYFHRARAYTYEALRYIILAVSCLVPAFYGLSNISDYDIWLHLKTGAWIWQHHAVPRVQLYSFLLGDKQWIDHEWLFQALIYPIYRLGGWPGLIIFRFCMIVLILFIFISLARRTRRLIFFCALAILICASLAVTRFLSLRPDIISLINIVLFLVLLKRYRGENWIYALVPLEIIWVNTHGYFILGLVFVLLFILTRVVINAIPLPFAWNNNTMDEPALRKLIYVFFLLLLVLLINPYLFKGALYPFQVIGQAMADPLEGRYAYQFITELQPLTVTNIVTQQGNFLLHAAIVLFFFSLLLNIYRVDIFDLLAFCIFFCLCIKANRHVSMLSLSLGVLTLSNLTQAEEAGLLAIKRNKAWQRLILLWAVPILGLFVFVSSLGISVSGIIKMARARSVNTLRGDSKGVLLGIEESIDQPGGVAAFMLQHHISGNILNHFNNGHYLIFKLYPYCKVFIDGRTELYGDILLKVFKRIFSKPDTIDKISKGLGIDAVVLPCNELSLNLFKHLSKSRQWRLVYFDGSGCVFVHNVPKFFNLIRDHKVILSSFTFNPDKRLIEIARSMKYYPTSFYNAATFFCDIGMSQKALKAMAVAEYVQPDLYEVHALKGKIMFRLKRFDEARAEFFKAAHIDKANPLSFKNIGVFYAKMGRPDIAREYFKAGLKANPRHGDLEYCLNKVNHYLDQKKNAITGKK